MFPHAILSSYKEIKHLSQALVAYVTLYENMINDRVNNSEVTSCAIVATFADSVKIFTDAISNETNKIISCNSSHLDKGSDIQNIKTTSCYDNVVNFPYTHVYNNSSLTTTAVGQIDYATADERELNLTV